MLLLRLHILHPGYRVTACLDITYPGTQIQPRTCACLLHADGGTALKQHQRHGEDSALFRQAWRRSAVALWTRAQPLVYKQPREGYQSSCASPAQTSCPVNTKPSIVTWRVVATCHLPSPVDLVARTGLLLHTELFLARPAFDLRNRGKISFRSLCVIFCRVHCCWLWSSSVSGSPFAGTLQSHLSLACPHTRDLQ